MHLNSSSYSYWLYDKETGALLGQGENLSTTDGSFSLPLDDYLEPGRHTFVLTASAPDYQSVELGGEYYAGEPWRNSFITIKLERGGDNGVAGGFYLEITPNEATITRRQEQTQNGTRRITAAEYRSSGRTDGAPVYGASTPRWSAGTSWISPDQYNANPSNYQFVSTRNTTTSVHEGYDVPVYGWQKTGTDVVQLSKFPADIFGIALFLAKQAYESQGYTATPNHRTRTDTFTLPAGAGDWVDTDETYRTWPWDGLPSLPAGYRWVWADSVWGGDIYKKQYNEVEYWRGQGYSVEAQSGQVGWWADVYRWQVISSTWTSSPYKTPKEYITEGYYNSVYSGYTVTGNAPPSDYPSASNWKSVVQSKGTEGGWASSPYKTPKEYITESYYNTVYPGYPVHGGSAPSDAPGATDWKSVVQKKYTRGGKYYIDTWYYAYYPIKYYINTNYYAYYPINYYIVTNYYAYVDTYDWVPQSPLRQAVSTQTAPSGYDYRNVAPRYETTGYTASKTWQELVGYTVTKDIYGWVRSGSQEVPENFRNYNSDVVTLDGLTKYAYSEKTPRCENVGQLMYEVRTIEGYDRETVGYDVPVYTQGWASEPVEAEVTLRSNSLLPKDVRLEVEAPAGIEATISQTDVNLGAGESVRARLRVGVSSNSSAPAKNYVTVIAKDSSGREFEREMFTLNVSTVFGPPYESSDMDKNNYGTNQWAGPQYEPYVYADRYIGLVIADTKTTLGGSSDATAMQYISFTPGWTGEATIEATVKYVEYTWGLKGREFISDPMGGGQLREGYYESYAYVVADVNSQLHEELIAASTAVGDVTGARLAVEGVKTLIDLGGELAKGWLSKVCSAASFGIDLWELKEEIEELGGSMQELNKINSGEWMQNWRTHVMKFNVQVQKGQPIRIGVGAKTQTMATYVQGTMAMAKIVGYVESIKI